jgi:peptide/nickel transport system substrate-binding protein
MDTGGAVRLRELWNFSGGVLLMLKKGRLLAWVGVLVALMAVGLSAAARTGAWVDEIVFVEEPSQGAAIAKLQAGEIDVFANSVGDKGLFNTVKADPNLKYYQSYGLYFDLTLNHGGSETPAFFADGRLNPFGVTKIREAMQWLIDREYIANEILGGLAVAKYSIITAAFPDYTQMAEFFAEFEEYYGYNYEKADQVITEEMLALGAYKEAGKWTYFGQPVEIIFLIRENQRTLIGNYIADQLESLGFAVVRRYGLGRELAPVWQQSNPNDGVWSLYTGGWIGGQVVRDASGSFDQYYSSRVMPYAPWQNVTWPDVLDTTADRLVRRDFNTLEERAALMDTVLWAASEFSNIIWLVDEAGFQPTRANVALAADLAGGIAYAGLAGLTFQFQENGVPVEGGTLTIAQPSSFVNPVNPINGSNWVFEQFPGRICGDYGIVVDPVDGLYWPLKAERAEVTVLTGLPVGVTNSWCTLKFADEIKVPAGAWVDWDAETQLFITAGVKYPEGLTAKRKSVIYYPADLYTTPLHDGSTLSIGDFVTYMILLFDQGKPKSPIFDEVQVPTLESFLTSFKGMRIVSQNPLAIEYYSDVWYLDAEWAVVDFFPFYGYGQGLWHTLAVGILAETDKELAFSLDKADLLSVEWTGYWTGPSLEILAANLDQAIATGYIPYAPTLGQYVTQAEAQERYANLKAWYAAKGHFGVGSGPFYLDGAYSTEKVLVLKRFEAYPEDSNLFQRFVK